MGRLRQPRRGTLRAGEILGLYHGQHVHLSLTYWSADCDRPGLQLVQRLRRVVPGLQTFDSTGDGEDRESEPRALRPPRKNTEGPPALLVGTHRALPELPELRRTF